MLYQCTHALVISSRSARVRAGPVRNGDPARMHSVLYRPMVVSARALSRASPTVATDGVSPASSRVWANRTEVYALRPRVAVVDRAVAHRVPLPCPPGRGLPDRPLYERGLLGQRALPPGDQPGERVDDERGSLIGIRFSVSIAVLPGHVVVLSGRENLQVGGLEYSRDPSG